MRAVCPITGKTRYASEAEAVVPDNAVIGSYRCPACEGWHREALFTDFKNPPPWDGRYCC